MVRSVPRSASLRNTGFIRAKVHRFGLELMNGEINVRADLRRRFGSV